MLLHERFEIRHSEASASLCLGTIAEAHHSALHRPAAEPEIEPDAILVHLHARPDIIRARMAADQHEYSLIDEEEIPQLQKEFAELFSASTLAHKVEIDTSELTQAQLVETYLERAKPHLVERDLALL